MDIDIGIAPHPVYNSSKMVLYLKIYSKKPPEMNPKMVCINGCCGQFVLVKCTDCACSHIYIWMYRRAPDRLTSVLGVKRPLCSSGH